MSDAAIMIVISGISDEMEGDTTLTLVVAEAIDLHATLTKILGTKVEEAA